MSKPADPLETFKNALSVTAVAMAGKRDAEVGFVADGGRVAGDRVLLRGQAVTMLRGDLLA